jgi:hypothetical protein
MNHLRKSPTTIPRKLCLAFGRRQSLPCDEPYDGAEAAHAETSQSEFLTLRPLALQGLRAAWRPRERHQSLRGAEWHPRTSLLIVVLRHSLETGSIGHSAVPHAVLSLSRIIKDATETSRMKSSSAGPSTIASPPDISRDLYLIRRPDYRGVKASNDYPIDFDYTFVLTNFLGLRISHEFTIKFG